MGTFLFIVSIILVILAFSWYEERRLTKQEEAKRKMLEEHQKNGRL